MPGRHPTVPSAATRMLALSTALLVACGTPQGAAPSSAAALAEQVPAAWPYPLDAPVATGASAMVTTDAPLATRAGLEMLRAGGNAIDAAIATAFVLAVVYPEAGNIGGGGFLVTRMADGTAAALDFREKAPLAATRDMFLDERGEPTDRSVIGHLASGVPGAVMGLWEAHSRFGTRPWAELLEPAIRLAADGFVVDDDYAGSIRDAANRLRRFDGSAELFLPGGSPIRAGERWTNPDLAAVLRRIAQAGPAGFYEGETADLIVAEMRRGGGLITHEDLARYDAKWREPIVFDYRDFSVISMPPASSGGITLALIAGILDEFPLERMGWHSSETLHVTAEAMRLAFADRNHYLGDSDYVDVPRELLLSNEHHDRLREIIDVNGATPSATVRPGAEAATRRSETYRSHAGAQAHAHAGSTAGAVDHATYFAVTNESGSERSPQHSLRSPAHAPADSLVGWEGLGGDHTTHFSIVDGLGNAVAFTTTINDLYGSAVTVTGAGFLLNNEMDDFTSKPGAPNLYGLVQGEANAIAPGKRMLSAMTPIIALDATGNVMLVTGARGGPRIITAVFQILSNIVDHGMDLGAAVNAPRIHHQHLPDVLYFERNGLTEAQVDALVALGHTVEPRGGYIGNAPTILRGRDAWLGVADPRQGGLAEGY